MTDEGLTPELLLQAYAAGIFPMAETRDADEVFWVDPRRRGVMPLDGFHLSRSLARRIRTGAFEITVNRDFESVIDACADRDETWINGTIRHLCLALHGAGDAHSLEVWQDSELAGGVALAYLVDRLRSQGFTLFDTQFLTPHLARLGAIEIPREDYRAQLREALGARAVFPGSVPFPDPQELVQRMTQTS